MSSVTVGTGATRRVKVVTAGAALEGELSAPSGASGVVVFAHGSGSSRHSPRNQAVAAELQRGGLATLLVDLLTRHEEVVDEATSEFRFNIHLLADRLAGATDWLARRADTLNLPVGYFGASTGAAAALLAAAGQRGRIAAVVSRGGRPDLAGHALALVTAPTLLIVGEDDVSVLELNYRALAALRCPKEIRIVPGASHLFEETGTLEAVGRLAREWFQRYVGRAAQAVGHLRRESHARTV